MVDLDLVAFQFYLEHSLETSNFIEGQGNVATIADYCMECLCSNSGKSYAEWMSNYLSEYYGLYKTVGELLSLAEIWRNSNKSKIILVLN